MSSNLKVNTILPSTGTSIGIGTAGGSITSNSPLSIASGGINVTGVSTFVTNTDGTTDLLTLHADADGTNNGVASIKLMGNAGNHAAFIKGGHTTNGDSILTFHTDAHASGINPEERLRINSNGAVMINTTNSSSRTLNLKGTFGILSASQTGVIDMSVTDAGEASIAPYVAGGSALVFKTNASGAGVSERLRILSDGKLLIGSSNPANNSRLGNELCIVGTEAFTGMSITNYPGTNASHAPLIDFNRSRGTSDQSMTSVVAGDKLGELIFRGANGSGFQDAITLRSYADTVSGSTVNGKFEIGTTNGSHSAKWSLSKEGYVTTPNNVIFSVNGGPSDVTNGVLVFSNVVFQRGGTNYNTSTGVFTAPVTGIYHFMCNPYRYVDSADSYIHLQRSTNSGSSWNNEIEVRAFSNGAAGWTSLALSNLIDLNAGWQVRITCTNRVHTNGTFTRFSGMLVG